MADDVIDSLGNMQLTTDEEEVAALSDVLEILNDCIVFHNERIYMSAFI